MINMDMIGRIREGKVYIGGVGHRVHSARDAGPGDSASTS